MDIQVNRLYLMDTNAIKYRGHKESENMPSDVKRSPFFKNSYRCSCCLSLFNFLLPQCVGETKTRSFFFMLLVPQGVEETNNNGINTHACTVYSS